MKTKARYAVLVAVILTGCTESAPPKKPVVNMTISKSDVGETWPLIKEPVTVNCGDGHTTIFLEAEGKAYAFNGAAESRPGAYTGKYAVTEDQRALLAPNPDLQQYGKLTYPPGGVLSVAIQRCRQAGLSDL
ncbi:DUF2511 domain-containing protein [Sphingomonas faeni]|uniref:DUF2511 domain-containing protein n=1 Tax=Sphingomonas faeni TaxID=185950 RepID=UPI003364FA89